jgi:hypothetical protein
MVIQKVLESALKGLDELHEGRFARKGTQRPRINDFSG